MTSIATETKKRASDSSAIRPIDDKPIDGRSIAVPTSAQEPKAEPKEVDVGNLSVEALLSLKEQDPFLYYSIPGVRRAELHSQEVDMSKLLDDDISGHGSSATSSTKVKRCTRLSLECHMDVLLQEDLGELEQTFDEKEMERIELGLTELTEMYGV